MRPSLENAPCSTYPHALKIAMILAAADGSSVITFEHIDAAWAVIEHAREVVKLLVAAAPPKNFADAEDRVRGAAEQLAPKCSGVFTVKKIYRRLKGARGLDFPTTLSAFNGLVAAG